MKWTAAAVAICLAISLGARAQALEAAGGIEKKLQELSEKMDKLSERIGKIEEKGAQGREAGGGGHRFDLGPGMDLRQFRIGPGGGLLELGEAEGTGGGKLGVRVRDLDEKIAKKLGVAEDAGALVEEVEDDSCAAGAGVKKGDLITRAGSFKIFSADKLSRAIRAMEPGESVEITLLRGGKEIKVAAKLDSRAQPDQRNRTQAPEEEQEQPPQPIQPPAGAGELDGGAL